MTILEISERVERGETVEIPADYFRRFVEESERLDGTHCWLMTVDGGTGKVTIRKDSHA